MDNRSPSLFRGQSLRALLTGWAAVFGPLLLCFLVQVPEISKVEKDAGGSLTGAFLESGLLYGLAGSIVLMLAFILPPVCRLRMTGRTRLADYIRMQILWLGVTALLLGVAAMVFVAVSGGNAWGQSLFSTALAAFLLLLIPALLACLAYWFIAIRGEGGMRAVTAFSVLFVLWNVLCFFVAGNWAALVAS